MNNLAEFKDGAEHILIADKLPSFVDKLIEEKVDSILLDILRLIKKILEGENATIAILNTQAITRLTTLLSHKGWRVCALLHKMTHLKCFFFSFYNKDKRTSSIEFSFY